MNILLTSAGRRNYMVDYFKQALSPYSGKVFVINSTDEAPAMLVADGCAISPLIYDSSYATFLLQYCLDHKIEVVISLFDIELPVLSKMKEQFFSHGIRIVVGDTWLTEMANDKWQTQLFLKENGFNTVQTFLSLDDFKEAVTSQRVGFPVFIKPRWGLGSLGLYKAEDIGEVEFCFNKARKEIANTYLRFESSTDIERAVMIQAAIPGQEYGMDIINDLDGVHCATIVKRKLSMRAGETDGAQVVQEETLSALGARIGAISKHPGNMDVDVFYDGIKAYILEFNPRFGGGYPFSHVAGVNLPKAIVEWHLGHSVNIDQLLSAKMGVKSFKGIEMVVAG